MGWGEVKRGGWVDTATPRERARERERARACTEPVALYGALWLDIAQRQRQRLSLALALSRLLTRSLD